MAALQIVQNITRIMSKKKELVIALPLFKMYLWKIKRGYYKGLIKIQCKSAHIGTFGLDKRSYNDHTVEKSKIV